MKNAIVYDSTTDNKLTRDMLQEASYCANCANSYDVEYHSCYCALLPKFENLVSNNSICVYYTPEKGR